MHKSQPEKKSILIVEDEPLLLDLYTDILLSEGFSVTQATNGVDGLHAICENDYDLVLLDTMIPKMDGLEVLATVKRDCPQIHEKKHIVMLSNLDQDTTMKKAMDLGAVDYLVKSDHTPDDIIRKIRKLLT